MTTYLVPLLVLFQLGTGFAYKSLLGGGVESSFFDINVDRSHPEKLYKEFEDFIVKYKRNYKDEIEKKFRFNQFVKSHNLISELSKKAAAVGSTATFGINKFADLTSKEFKSRLSKDAPGNYSNVPVFNLGTGGRHANRTKRELDNFPLSFDLREKKINGRRVVGEVKNQGHCGCCWAFAATVVAEAALTVHRKKFLSLSDQEVCDCGATEMPGCKGGDPMLGLQYIEEHGITSDDEYIYEDGRSNTMQCDAEEHEREINQFELSAYKLNRFSAEHQIMMHLTTLNVPVAAVFRVGEDFRFYSTGVLSYPRRCDEEEKHVWHSAAIVGYGTETDGHKLPYWIVKNSWNNDWGNYSGYFYVHRGVNWCDVETHLYGARIPE